MKPKQQTKQQLMEEQIEALQSESKAVNEALNKIWRENVDLKSSLETSQIDRERCVKVIDRQNKSLDRFAIAIIVGTILGFAIGLYTGHKITGRCFSEKLIAAQNSEYRRGLDSGIGMGADYIKELRSRYVFQERITNGFKATHLNRKGMTIEEIKHKFEATHLTREGVMAHAGNPFYNRFHNPYVAKGAERLRL